MSISSLEPLLKECDTAIDLAKAGDIDGARLHLDRIRYFRSVIAADDMAGKDAFQSMEALFGGDPELLHKYAGLAATVNQRLEFLHQWISQSRASFSMDELRQSSQGMQLFIDDALPGIWDLKQDVIVVTDDDGAIIRDLLRARGQAKFVWVTKDHPKPQAEPEEIDEDTVYISPASEGGAERLAAILQTHAVPRVALITTNGSLENEQNFHAVVRSIGSVVIGGTTSQWLQQQTAEQWLELAPQLVRFNSATLLKPLLNGRDVLIVSPGPSLARDIALLTKYQDRFLILAGVKALNALLDANITPDFAVWQDPRDHSYAIPVRPEIGGIKLILNESCHPAFFRSGFGEYIVYPDPGFLGTALSTALHGDDIPFLAGTSVSTLSAVLALAMGAKSVTLIGQDLSISEGLYVGGAGDNSALETDGPPMICKGIDGEELPTQPNYYSFIGEFRNIGQAFRERATLINSTAKGAYLDNWEHVPFSKHPLVLSDSAADKARLSIDASKPKEDKREVALAALQEMLGQLEHAKNLCAELYRYCNETIETNSNDVTVIDLLERRLKLILDDECPLLKYYTSRQSLALTRATPSVQSLEENLRLSAGYYKSIEVAASKLIRLCESAVSEVEGANGEP